MVQSCLTLAIEFVDLLPLLVQPSLSLNEVVAVRVCPVGIIIVDVVVLGFLSFNINFPGE